jgi:hypothetical protein
VVFPQCELSNVSANLMIGKTTLHSGGRYNVSHQCELLNGPAGLLKPETILNSGSI